MAQHYDRNKAAYHEKMAQAPALRYSGSDALSNDHLRRAVAASGVGIAIRNLMDRSIVINEAFERLLGYSAEELSQIHFSAITHPEDRTSINLLHNEIYKGIGISFHAVKRLCRKDGSYVWVATDTTAIPSQDGRPQFTININQDISELKKAERQIADQSSLLNETLQSMAHGFATFDKARCLVAFNEKFERMCGFPSGFIKKGLVYEDIARARLESQGCKNASLQEQVTERIGSLAAKAERAAELVSPDGTIYLSTRKPTRNGGFVITLTDITDRKRAEDQTRRALEAAEAANRSKSEFIANMSHELRTPLNAIIGFAEIISSQGSKALGESRVEEYASDISEAGHHLLGLINDILDIAKVTSGQITINEEWVRPEKIVEHCVKLVGNDAFKKGMEVAATFSAQNFWLSCDPRMLRQILINLLSNAVKFSPKDGGKILVKSWAHPESGYVIQISDNGIGIEPADIPRVLQPFVQAQNAMTREHSGTGLGLPLAKKLVELHGGILDLQSMVEQGTTVSVRFPAHRIKQGHSWPAPNSSRTDI